MNKRPLCREEGKHSVCDIMSEVHNSKNRVKPCICIRALCLETNMLTCKYLGYHCGLIRADFSHESAFCESLKNEVARSISIKNYNKKEWKWETNS